MVRHFLLVVLLSVALLSVKASSDNAAHVHDVTAENIDSFFAGKSSFILEFYAPWCQHCTQFELPYSKVAARLAKEKQMTYKVGRVNVEENQALQSRFGVRYLPMLLFVIDGETYLYDGSLTYTDVLSFALTDFKKSEPLSLLDSPFGPVGTLKGYLIKAGLSLLAFHPWVMGAFGVSDVVAYLLVAVIIGMTFFVVVFAGVFVQVQGLKND